MSGETIVLSLLIIIVIGVAIYYHKTPEPPTHGYVTPAPQPPPKLFTPLEDAAKLETVLKDRIPPPERELPHVVKRNHKKKGAKK